MATYNEYEDKETLIENPSIPDINKVKANDMNYIKYNLPHIGTSVDSSYNTNLIKGKNLFDKNTALANSRLDSTGNIVSDNSYTCSQFIKVKPNTKYTFSANNNDYFQHATYTSDKTFIVRNNSSGNVSTYTITTGATAEYIIIVCANTNVDSYMFQEGEVSSPTYSSFIPNSIVVEGEKFTETIGVGTSVNSANRVNVLHSDNLFNKQPIYYNNSTISNISNGIRITAIASSNSFTLFKMIDVSNLVGKSISVKCNFTTSGNLGQYIIGLCDENGGNRIVGNSTTTSGTTITYTIPTITTSKYLALWLYASPTANTYTDYTNIMVNMGDTSLDYEPYITPSIVVDNEEIYSKPVVLWTNSSPSSSFSNQAITLLSSDYNYLEIYSFQQNTGTLLCPLLKLKKGYGGKLITKASGSICDRNVSYTNETTLTFDKCYVGSTENNAYLIPYQIIGYK